MSEWKARRFWDTAQVTETGGGYTVRLDARAIKTPGKSDLIVPTEALAQAIAAEWQAQDKAVDPRTMPVTRAANTAIDKVAPHHAEMADMLAAYADADATCYRADAPAGLVQRQAEGWDPLLDWAADTFGARLIPVEGVVHVAQSPRSLEKLAEPVHAMTPFELTGFHDLVSLSGSLIIGLAAARFAWPVEDLWALSRIDETWQEQQWGADDEATATAANKRTAFLDSFAFYEMSRVNP